MSRKKKKQPKPPRVRASAIVTEDARPTPVQAIQQRRARQFERLAARSDPFSKLLSRMLDDELVGTELLSKSALSESDRQALEASRADAHEAFRLEMDTIVQTLRQKLSEGSPLYTLAYIHAANVMRGWGTYYEPTHEGFESKVEVVAGLLLTQPPGPADARLDAAAMQEVHDQLDSLIDLIFLRNLTAPRDDHPVVAELRFMGALNWMTMRGTSYAHHGRDLARALYEPFDDWCLREHGFTIDDVLRVGETIEALWRAGMNALTEEARALADAVGREVSQRSFRTQLTPEQAAQLDSPENMTLLLSGAAIEVFEHGIAQAVTSTADDVAKSGLPRERVEAVLRELSLTVGSLTPHAYTGLFDENPLVERPLVEFEGRYLLAVPGMLLRDTATLLERRFMSGPPGYPNARAKTLDALAVKWIGRALPGSSAYRNLFYAGAELDGLVLFENLAFVIEGKGSGLSVPAQRGDVARLQRDIARAVEEAWEQGARARSYLLADQDAVFTDASGAEVVRISAGSVQDVMIVNPTLHELAGHAVQLPRLRSLGLFPDGEYPWSVFINDLRVISETCGNAAVFLHYLTWRSRLPLGEGVTALDEIDLWGSYLLSERFGRLAEGGHYILGNSSTDFDAFYAGEVGDGPRRSRPKKFLDEPITSFVERMATERPPGWLQAAGVCLDLSLAELAVACFDARRLWREANRTGTPAVVEVGRLRLIGLPRGVEPAEVGADVYISDEPTFNLFVRGSKAKRGEVAWAEQLKPVTFELSDFERATTARI
jgi:hypothetical protein